LQRIFITLQFFGENSMANHAAACAYGFLLSMTPLLLIICFFMFHAFHASTQGVIDLIKSIPFLDSVINQEWLTADFFSITRPGISGFIFMLSIFWAGRLLALSLQRGLKIIFTGTKKRNPVTDNLITLTVEAVALILSLVIIFSSQTALYLYETFNFIPKTSFLHPFMSKLGSAVFTLAVLGLVSYCAYRFIPANPPRRISALKGSIFFILTFECAAAALAVMLRQSRYNFLYGALGNLVVLLVNVYFLFMFFFMGSQFAFVSDFFDAVLFVKMRKARDKIKKHARVLKRFPLLDMENKLFYSIEGNLQKYSHTYKKGEIIFTKDDDKKDIYYIFEGEVEALILSVQNREITGGTLEAGSFFGEMSHLLSEERSATIRAKTDVSVLVLPPKLFDEILMNDISLDRTIIENMSRRIKAGNAQIAALM